MYGVIVSAAILISLLLAEYIAKKDDKDTSVLWGGAFWTVLFGVIGARLYHVIDLWNYYSADPVKILQVWHGGLGIIGGIVAGIVALSIYLKVKGEKILGWLDILAVVTPFGQFIGRWANVWNRELLPVAYYEMVLNLALFAGLFAVYKWYAKRKSGLMLILYILGYTLIRLGLQPFRS